MLKKTVLTTSTAINTGMILALLAATAAQLLIRLDSVNIGCAAVITAVSLATLMYLRWTDALVTHPLSSFALLGFCVTTQFGALVTQSLAWTPVMYELRQPFTTFCLLGMFQVIALGAHACYRLLPPLQFGDGSLVRRGLRHAGLYATPTVAMLWLFGLVGFVSHLTGGGDAAVGGKLIAGFRFLIFAPFLIPIYVHQEGPAYCRAKLHFLYLGLYFVCVALMAIAANTRGLMLRGIVTIGLVLLLWLMRNAVRMSAGQVGKVAAGLLLAVAVIGPFSYLSTAMVVARQNNGVGGGAKASPAKMVEKTYLILQQPALIDAYRLRAKLASSQKVYDENYIANPMLARFVETKFHDNAFFFSANLSPSSEESLQRVTVELLWAILPEPALALIGVDVNKATLNFSMGDYLLYLNKGVRLGGKVTGSAFAQGLALFGVMFPVMYFFIAILLFSLTDLLSFRGRAGTILLTVPAMIQIFGFFISGIAGESLHQMVTQATRGLAQSILIYLFVFYLAKFAVSLYPRTTPAAA